jgi:hypothetical protein
MVFVCLCFSDVWFVYNSLPIFAHMSLFVCF